jgi:hypothetical protein
VGKGEGDPEERGVRVGKAGVGEGEFDRDAVGTPELVGAPVDGVGRVLSVKASGVGVCTLEGKGELDAVALVKEEGCVPRAELEGYDSTEVKGVGLGEDEKLTRVGEGVGELEALGGEEVESVATSEVV